MEKRMDSLSNSQKQIAQTQGWQQASQQQQQTNFQKPQRPAAGQWNQSYQATPYQAPPFQKGICFRFRDAGKCDFDGCKFSHTDGGNTTSRPQKQGPGIPQMHAQRQANLQQQQQPNNLVPFCYAFQKGQCARGQTCRFAHEFQRPQRQQQQQPMQRPADLPPSRACRNVWATSTCDNWNCKFEHGSFDARGEPCKNFLTRSHCPYIFSSVGCKFSHAREQDANQVPLGGARTQRELLSKATPDQKDP